MSHTKAPWKLKFKKNSDWSVYGKDGYSIMAISYDTEYGRPTEDEANAHLIVAAPDMLDVLERLDALLKRENIKLDGYSQMSIDKVLKKARGEL